MSEIKAIETQYKGFRFRSRLEARWAVFFDKMGIEWKYESEGYDINGTYYLPDFFLPKSGTWVEVKGDWDSLPKDYWTLLGDAVDFGGYLPGIRSGFGSTRGLLLLSDIPEPCEDDIQNRYDCRIVHHAILQHHKGIVVQRAFFRNQGLEVVGDCVDAFGSSDELRLLSREITLRSYVGLVCWTNNFSGHSVWDASMSASAGYGAARSARFEHGESP